MSASERDPRVIPSRRLPRRTILQLGLGALASIPLAVACGQPSTPAKPEVFIVKVKYPMGPEHELEMTPDMLPQKLFDGATILSVRRK